jgi:hypothetical protein
MTEKKIQVVAMVVDPTIITFYKTDGSVFTITQGDPRGLRMSDDYLEQHRQGVQIKELNVDVDIQTVNHLNNGKRNPLIRFFAAPIASIKKLFGKQSHETGFNEAEHEEAAARVKAVAALLMKSPEGTNATELPIRVITDELQPGETLIAVTDEGIVPHVENLTDQFKAADEDKAPKGGADQLLIRLAAISNRRGHTGAELLGFVKKIDLPILSDGSFMAYKRLRRTTDGKYVDPHSGLVIQRVGDIVQMDESLVDKNRRQECSQGIHVGTRHYMGGFHAKNADSGTCLVLIQPEDVIAVPQNEASKMRVCRYLLLWDLGTKGHELVNQNKRVDACPTSMELIAQLAAGARPALLGTVNIGGDSGTNLKYTINGNDVPTETTYQEALTLSGRGDQAATSPVVPVRTIDDSKNGNAKDFKTEKVRDPANAVKPADVRQKTAATPASTPAAKPQSVRETEAQRLFNAMNTGSPADRRVAALGLKEFKKKAKISWKAIGLPADMGDTIQKLLDQPVPAETKPSTPAPSKPAQAKKIEPAKTAPQPKQESKVKAEPEPKDNLTKASPANETRGDKARRLWENATNPKLSGNHQKQALEELVQFKRAAKVSWERLNLYTHKVEAEMKKRGL